MWGIIKINISPEGCHCCAVIVVMCDVVVSDCGSGDNDIVVVVGHCKIKHLKQIRYSPRGGAVIVAVMDVVVVAVVVSGK